jgi:plastocyanin
MSNETLFYVFGIGLAVSAVSFSLAGLKIKDFPGKAFPVVVLWFAILVGGATTFAVLHAKDEQSAKAAELKVAGKEIEKEQSGGPVESEGAEESQGEGEETEAEPEANAKGPGGTLQLAADPTELKFDKAELTSKPGKVTIDFKNPSPLEHDVEIEQNGKELGGTEIIRESEATATVELASGTYTFFCSVPGHRQAGMEGTLVVK